MGKIIARKINSLGGETHSRIEMAIGGILDETSRRIEKFRGKPVKPLWTLARGEIISEKDFESARKEFQDIASAENGLTMVQKRHLDIVYLSIFEGKNNAELMARFATKRPNVKIGKSRGIDLIWEKASENLRRILSGIKPLRNPQDSPQTPPPL